MGNGNTYNTSIFTILTHEVQHSGQHLNPHSTYSSHKWIYILMLQKGLETIVFNLNNI